LAGAWRAVQALAIVLAAWVLLYLPFWDGLGTLSAAVSGPASTLYMHSMAGDVLWNAPEALANLSGVTEDRELFIEGVRQSLSENLRLYLIVVFGLVALAITWKACTFSRALIAWGWVAFAAILAQGWFWPWYVSWMIVPAALARSERLRKTALVFSVSGLLLYLEEQILSPHFRFFLDWSGVLVMVPPLAYVCFSWLVEVRRSRQARRVLVAHSEESAGLPWLEREAS
jgi:hypothetical protein